MSVETIGGTIVELRGWKQIARHVGISVRAIENRVLAHGNSYYHMEFDRGDYERNRTSIPWTLSNSCNAGTASYEAHLTRERAERAGAQGNLWRSGARRV